MKKFQLYLTFFACGLFLTLNSCDSNELSISPDEMNELQMKKTEVSAKGNSPSVNGQGTITLVNGTSRHFSFHANTNKDGSISGNGVLTYTEGERKIMFDINCLSIDEGTATISGNITKDKQVDAYIGSVIWFQVVDNGEGKNAAPDQMTLMITNSSIECDSDLSYTLAFYDIEGGNIQLKN